MESNEKTLESLLRTEYQHWGVHFEAILQKTLQIPLSFSLFQIKQETPAEILRDSFSENVFVILTLTKAENFRIGIRFSRSSLDFFLDQMLGGSFDSKNQMINEEAVSQNSSSMTFLEKRLIKKIISLFFESFFCSLDNFQQSKPFNVSPNDSVAHLLKNEDHSFRNVPQNKMFFDENEKINNETDSIFISEKSVPNWILQETKRTVSYRFQIADQAEKISFYLDRTSEENLFPQIFSQVSKQQKPSKTQESDIREVIIEIGQIKISSEKLASLKAGDILKTDIPANSPFFIKWDNVLRFSGKPGLFQEVPSIQIEKEL